MLCLSSTNLFRQQNLQLYWQLDMKFYGMEHNDKDTPIWRSTVSPCSDLYCKPLII